MRKAKMELFKNLLLPIASLAILISGQSQAMEKANKGNYWYATSVEKSITNSEMSKHQADPQTQEIMNRDLHQLKHKIRDVYELQSLAQTIIKKNGINRIIGSLCVKQCIEDDHLDAIKVPNKKLYFDGMGNDYVIEPEINIVEHPLSLKQIQQLYTVVKQTGYKDNHNGNIVNTAEGVAYIIDTGPGSFMRNISYEQYRKEVQDHFTLPHFIHALIAMEFNLTMDSKAQEWITQKIQKNILKFKAINTPRTEINGGIYENT